MDETLTWYKWKISLHIQVFPTQKCLVLPRCDFAFKEWIGFGSKYSLRSLIKERMIPKRWKPTACSWLAADHKQIKLIKTQKFRWATIIPVKKCLTDLCTNQYPYLVKTMKIISFNFLYLNSYFCLFHCKTFLYIWTISFKNFLDKKKFIAACSNPSFTDQLI